MKIALFGVICLAVGLQAAILIRPAIPVEPTAPVLELEKPRPPLIDVPLHKPETPILVLPENPIVQLPGELPVQPETPILELPESETPILELPGHVLSNILIELNNIIASGKQALASPGITSTKIAVVDKIGQYFAAAKELLEQAKEKNCETNINLTVLQIQAYLVNRKCEDYFDSKKEQALSKLPQYIEEASIYKEQLHKNILACVAKGTELLNSCYKELLNVEKSNAELLISNINNNVAKIKNYAKNVQGCKQYNEKEVEENLEKLMNPIKLCVKEAENPIIIHPEQPILELHGQALANILAELKNVLASGQKTIASPGTPSNMIGSVDLIAQLFQMAQHVVEVGKQKNCEANIPTLNVYQIKAYLKHKQCQDFFESVKEYALESLRRDVENVQVYRKDLNKKILACVAKGTEGINNCYKELHEAEKSVAQSYIDNVNKNVARVQETVAKTETCQNNNLVDVKGQLEQILEPITSCINQPAVTPEQPILEIHGQALANILAELKNVLASGQKTIALPGTPSNMIGSGDQIAQLFKIAEHVVDYGKQKNCDARIPTLYVYQIKAYLKHKQCQDFFESVKEYALESLRRDVENVQVYRKDLNKKILACVAKGTEVVNSCYKELHEAEKSVAQSYIDNVNKNVARVQETVAKTKTCQNNNLVDVKGQLEQILEPITSCINQPAVTPEHPIVILPIHPENPIVQLPGQLPENPIVQLPGQLPENPIVQLPGQLPENPIVQLPGQLPENPIVQLPGQLPENPIVQLPGQLPENPIVQLPGELPVQPENPIFELPETETPILELPGHVLSNILKELNNIVENGKQALANPGIQSTKIGIIDKIGEYFAAAKELLEQAKEKNCETNIKSLTVLQIQAYLVNRKCDDYFEAKKEGALVNLNQYVEEANVYKQQLHNSILACVAQGTELLNSCYKQLLDAEKSKAESLIQSVKQNIVTIQNHGKNVQGCKQYNEQQVQQHLDDLMDPIKLCVNQVQNPVIVLPGHALANILGQLNNVLASGQETVAAPTSTSNKIGSVNKLGGLFKMAQQIVDHAKANNCQANIPPLGVYQIQAVLKHQQCEKFYEALQVYALDSLNRDIEIVQNYKEALNKKIFACVAKGTEVLNSCYQELLDAEKTTAQLYIQNINKNIETVKNHVKKIQACQNNNLEKVKLQIEQLLAPITQCTVEVPNETLPKQLSEFEQLLDESLALINKIIPSLLVHKPSDLEKVLSVAKGVITHAIENQCGGSLEEYEALEKEVLEAHTKCQTYYTEKNEDAKTQLRGKVILGQVLLNKVNNRLISCAKDVACVNALEEEYAASIEESAAEIKGLQEPLNKHADNIKGCQAHNLKLAKQKVEALVGDLNQCTVEVPNETLPNQLAEFDKLLQKSLAMANYVKPSLKIYRPSEIHQVFEQAKTIVAHAVENQCGGSLEELAALEELALATHQNCQSYYTEKSEQAKTTLRGQAILGRVLYNKVNNQLTNCAKSVQCVNALEEQYSPSIEESSNKIQLLQIPLGHDYSATIAGCQDQTLKQTQQKVEALVNPLQSCHSALF